MAATSTPTTAFTRVTVTLTDDDGGVTVQTFNVTVNNVAPTLTVPANQTVNEGATAEPAEHWSVHRPGL